MLSCCGFKIEIIKKQLLTYELNGIFETATIFAGIDNQYITCILQWSLN